MLMLSLAYTKQGDLKAYTSFIEPTNIHIA